ncbi:FkbM family methyltransferase [Hymenobacter koreensis]|uniref:Methyltransferase FkbM domain-containing protein n=1 Tax=Hymenobacter koreensis TaxID=1084523 RepID=A0ABP8JLG7_9BACT
MNITKLTLNKHLLYWLSKVGYLRNRKTLTNLRVLEKGRFFIYNLEGFHIASEAFNWYLTKDVLEQEVLNVSCRYYRPKPGDTVVDIGAGLGEECSIYSQMVGKSGHVYAIEANPTVFRALSEVTALNHATNVQLFNIAINDKRAKVAIEDAHDSYLSASLDNKASQGVTYQVEGLPFAEFCADHSLRHIDLLKVNIEGAERFMESAFQNPELTIRNVAISCHDFRFVNEGNEFFRTKALVSDFLTKAGYEICSQQTGKGYVDDWVYGRKK